MVLQWFRLTYVLQNRVLIKFNKNILNYYWTISTLDNSLILQHTSLTLKLKYPIIWLRDNCQCKTCFDQDSHSRLIPLQNLDTEIQIVSSEVVELGQDVSLRVQWSDSHSSIYQIDWLQKRSFSSEEQLKWLKTVYRPQKILWNSSDFQKICAKYPYASLLSRDDILLEFLTRLDIFGVVVVENAGVKGDELEKLANRIGFLKRTYYGKYYHVRAKPKAENVAYLPKPLQPHTDLPYYAYSPGVNILHYLIQPPAEDEGRNQLADAFYVANKLKTLYPHKYEVLAKMVVEWSDIGEDKDYKFHSIHRAPVICETSSGEIEKINFSQPQRDSHFCVSVGEANLWYKAIKEFIDILYKPDVMVNCKMKQGDMLAFDNHRVLHGRGGYSSERHVLGGYMDWDIVRSKIRVLQKSH